MPSAPGHYEIKVDCAAETLQNLALVDPEDVFEGCGFEPAPGDEIKLVCMGCKLDSLVNVGRAVTRISTSSIGSVCTLLCSEPNRT